MRRSSFLLGGAAAVIAGAGTLLFWQLPGAASPAAAVGHTMVHHGAPAAVLHHAKAAANEVVIDDFSFGPAQLTVTVGTRVMWTNDDSDPHTVTSEDAPKLFKSPALDTGQSFAFTFDKPGTYHYFCSIHPRMQGTIIVQ